MTSAELAAFTPPAFPFPLVFNHPAISTTGDFFRYFLIIYLEDFPDDPASPLVLDHSVNKRKRQLIPLMAVPPSINPFLQVSVGVSQRSCLFLKSDDIELYFLLLLVAQLKKLLAPEFLKAPYKG